MLAKRQRLTTAAFDAAFKAGKRTHHPLFQLVHVPGEEFHAAVVVGKKVAGNAVDRNRLRRQFYGVIYRQHQNTALTGTYLLLVKPAARSVGAAERGEALRSVLVSRTNR